MMRAKVVLGVLFCLLILGCTSEVNQTNNMDDELVNELVNYLEEEKFNGSILIHLDGKTILSKGFGYANVDEEILNTPDTVYLATTLTLQFTAVSILMLEEQGLLNVEDLYLDHIDEFPNMEGITIHHLLTHTAGLVDYHRGKFGSGYGESNLDYIQVYRSPLELINLVSEFNLKFEPGSRLDYNASNYVYLGYLIEEVSGLTYEEFVKENILIPLGMENTGFSYIDELDNQALSYDISTSVKDGQQKYYLTDPYNASWQYAFAGLSSSVEDLYKWHEALSNYELISKESLDKMFTPHTVNPYTDNPYGGPGNFYGALAEPIPAEGFGYGWIIDKSGELPTVYHMATAKGFSGNMYKDFEKDTFIVFLCNVDDGDHLYRRYSKSHDLRDGLIDILNSNDL